MTPPRIAYVPYFVALADIGCTRMEVAVYGAIAAFQAHGYSPSMDELAWTAGGRLRRQAYAAVAELERRRLLRRERQGNKRNRYELLGPTLSSQQGETGT